MREQAPGGRQVFELGKPAEHWQTFRDAVDHHPEPQEEGRFAINAASPPWDRATQALADGEGTRERSATSTSITTWTSSPSETGDDQRAVASCSFVSRSKPSWSRRYPWTSFFTLRPDREQNHNL
jgi:hypothetical protein